MAELKEKKESKREKKELKKEKKELKKETKESKKEKRERKKEKRSVKQEDAEGSEDESEDKKASKKVKKSAKQDDAEDSEDESDSNTEKTEDGSSDELEIDLSAQVPLSKKQQRLLKKGKLDLAKIAKKHPTPKPATEDGESTSTLNKSPFGVWIGNLSFDTTKEDIVRFIVAKTKNTDDDDEKLQIEEKDITRVNLPKKANKIKGFAYLDLPSAKHVERAVELSESFLNGRNLLIKSSSSFEGRPEEHTGKALLKNPPLRILFVGNLSFDTTDDLLEEHFRHCGDIVRIRMATFEDSGKCKGFAFIDFKDEKGPTTALKSKLAKSLINRPLRLEYGEDRSKRNPRKAAADGDDSETPRRVHPERSERIEGFTERPARQERSERPERTERFERPERKRAAPREREQPAKRLKSSVALATAQRASAAIVPSKGKKITFD